VGISITEIIVVFVVALILFGPEQLPVMARSIGKITGQVKKTSDALRREFYNSVYTPAPELRRELTAELKDLRSLKAEVLAPPSGSQGTKSRPEAPTTQDTTSPPEEKTA
jgi:sec-independent protein translocase protein TatA